MIVCITGIDGAGKTTLVSNLSTWLNDQDVPAQSVKIALFHNSAYQHYRETISWAKDIAPQTEQAVRATLIALETCKVVREQVIPAHEQDIVVLCDRYIEGSACYLKARQIPNSIFNDLTRSLPQPALRFLLDLPINISIERLRALNEHPNPDQILFLKRMQKILQEWACMTNATILNALLPETELVELVGHQILGTRTT